jgi:hypothetical protein
MIKSASLQTFEIDDMALACRELKAQLNQKLNLLQNSIGIIQCDSEFVSAGLPGLLHAELGMPLVGGTTISVATNGAVGNFSFSMLVLTSDDVEFAAAHTDNLDGGHIKAIENSLKEATLALSKPMKLVLAFPPAFGDFSGDCYIEEFERACGKIPVFGTNPVDLAFPDFSHTFSIHDGEAFNDEMAYAILCGNLRPRFFVAAVPPQADIIDSVAHITRSKDNVIHEINHMPAIKYLESMGLATDGKLKGGLDFLPLLVTLGEAESPRPFVRALKSIEGACAVCSGKMAEGAKIAFGSYNEAEVMAATAETVALAADEKEINAALIYSCIVRQFVIGIDSMKEIKKIRDIFPQSVPFMASYSGGELAPTYVDEDAIAQNRYHNYSLVMCLL